MEKGNLTGREGWSYLEQFNGDLLYAFASRFDVASDEGGKHTKSLQFSCDEMREDDISHTTYYLIYFVYKFVLGCNTLDEAMKYANVETFRKYNLTGFFGKNLAITLGNEAFGTVELSLRIAGSEMNGDTKMFSGYVATILEIVYCKYNYLEQLDCFIRHNQPKKKRSQKYKSKKVQAAEEALDNSIEYMLKKPQLFRGLLYDFMNYEKDLASKRIYSSKDFRLYGHADKLPAGLFEGLK